MNQLTIANPIFKKLIDRASTIPQESYVSDLWSTVLVKAGLNSDHGFIISTERKISRDMRTDIIVELILSDTIVMIVECKSIAHDNLIGWGVAEAQLAEYLKATRCRN